MSPAAAPLLVCNKLQPMQQTDERNEHYITGALRLQAVSEMIRRAESVTVSGQCTAAHNKPGLLLTLLKFSRLNLFPTTIFIKG